MDFDYCLACKKNRIINVLISHNEAGDRQGDEQRNLPHFPVISHKRPLNNSTSYHILLSSPAFTALSTVDMQGDL